MSEHSDRVIWLQSELDAVRDINARQAKEITELRERLSLFDLSDCVKKPPPEFVRLACDVPGHGRR